MLLCRIRDVTNLVRALKLQNYIQISVTRIRIEYNLLVDMHIFRISIYSR